VQQLSNDTYFMRLRQDPGIIYINNTVVVCASPGECIVQPLMPLSPLPIWEIDAFQAVALVH
jgi:hypothetical protein